MSTTIDLKPDTDRDGETSLARTELLRRAKVQGVKPITTVNDLAGDPQLTADLDVDEFLSQLSADRDRPSSRSVQ